MSIWVYKNRELLYNTSISNIKIYKEYNITLRTVKKYKDNKIYKEYYFSTHRLTNEELNNIFPILNNGNSINRIIDSNTIGSTIIDSNTIGNTNEQILKSINELKKQVNELRKETIELKEFISKLTINIDTSSTKTITKMLNKIELANSNSTYFNLLDNQFIILSDSNDVLDVNKSLFAYISCFNPTLINEKNRDFIKEILSKAIIKINSLYKISMTREEVKIK